MDDGESQRRRQAEERFRREQQEKLEQKIFAEKAEAYKREALIVFEIEDKQEQQKIAVEAARIYAERLSTPGNVHYHDDRGVVKDAIARVEALKIDLAAAQIKYGLDEIVILREKEDENKNKDAKIKGDKLVDSAKELGARDQTAADAWTKEAQTVERLRHQTDRYNALRSQGPMPSPQPAMPAGLSEAAQRRFEQLTGGPVQPQVRLNANEIHASAGSPELRARYNHQEAQRTAQQSTSSTPAETRVSISYSAAQEKRAEMSEAARRRFEQMTRGYTQENEERDRARQNEQGRRGPGGRTR